MESDNNNPLDHNHMVLKFSILPVVGSPSLDWGTFNMHMHNPTLFVVLGEQLIFPHPTTTIDMLFEVKNMPFQ